MKNTIPLIAALIVLVLMVLAIPLISQDPMSPGNGIFSRREPTSTPEPFTSTASSIPVLPSPTQTPTPQPSRTATPTPTATTTLQPAWIYHLPGPAVVPILLYHHVAEEGGGTRYYIPPAQFQAQMELLKTWGYSSITIADLVKVINEGGFLPERPIVITFDDGNLDVYENAFPIMRSLELVGSVSIIANTLTPLNGVYNIQAKQLVEMAQAGWEIGSHGMNHVDLTQAKRQLREELEGSRRLIEEQTKVKVNVLAYPFGMTDATIRKAAQGYGYVAGLGLGVSLIHSADNLDYLSRIEIEKDYDLKKFASLLPWKGPLEEGAILPEIYVLETPETPMP